MMQDGDPGKQDILEAIFGLAADVRRLLEMQERLLRKIDLGFKDTNDRIDRGFKDTNGRLGWGFDRLGRKLDRMFYLLVVINGLMAAAVVMAVLDFLGD